MDKRSKISNNKNNLKLEEEKINHYRTLLGAYYGILSIDEYELKAYVLKDIKKLISDYEVLLESGIDLKKEEDSVKMRVSIRVKWQDALTILNEIDGDKELMYIIRMRIKQYEKELI